MGAQTYNFKVSGAVVWSIRATGRFVYYVSGGAKGLDTRIRIKHQSSGLQMDLYPGQAFELEEGAKRGADWTVENVARQGEIIGELVIGDGRFYDNRIIGDMSQAEGELLRVRRGESFFGSCSPVGVGGDYLGAQIFVPPGVKGVAVRKVVLSSLTTQTLQIVSGAPQFTSLDYGTFAPKKSGGQRSTAFKRGYAGPVFAANPEAFFWVRNDTPYEINFSTPVYVPPGGNFSVINNSTTAGAPLNFSAYFEFDEVLDS